MVQAKGGHFGRPLHLVQADAVLRFERKHVYVNVYDSALIEFEKIKKDLEAEDAALSDFLQRLATCKDENRTRELIKESQLSAAKLSSLKADFIRAQVEITKLQSDRIKNLTRNVEP